MKRLFCLLTSIVAVIVATASEYKLWYNQPAQTWTQSLPIGNGVMGGMVFGT
ncbi:MAG: glycoside hydrolase N-terminal domain-containing protein, partial [Prevotella sp.]|nr:glycoside hydrolase N-terminal domain-containing protein [Prevotella sp.]